MLANRQRISRVLHLPEMHFLFVCVCFIYSFFVRACFGVVAILLTGRWLSPLPSASLLPVVQLCTGRRFHYSWAPVCLASTSRRGGTAYKPLCQVWQFRTFYVCSILPVCFETSCDCAFRMWSFFSANANGPPNTHPCEVLVLLLNKFYFVIQLSCQGLCETFCPSLSV